MIVGEASGGVMLTSSMVDRVDQRVRFELDADAPFLRDHRVGSTAILSTVMGIEAMAEATVALTSGRVVLSVERLSKRGPVLVQEGESRSIEIEVSGSSVERVRCRLVSDPDDSRVIHDEAILVLGPALADSPARRIEVPADGLGAALTQGTLYDLFFHGPAFRVIGSARLWRERLVAEFAADLPPLVAPGAQSAVAPRLLEVCLQASGVLELVRSGRMRIPRSIDSIVRYAPRAESSGYRAIVAKRSPEDDEDSAYDMTLIDDDGAVLVEVLGYRSDPFDQQVDESKVAAVVGALNG